MHHRLSIFAGAALLVAGWLVARSAAAGEVAAPPAAWTEVPRILARITPPQFPTREFLVTGFGAVGDGTHDCTEAFRKAIAACHSAGGGRVVVPPGKFLTGAIHLQSGVNLHLEAGATILFSTDPNRFLPVVFVRDVAECMNYSPFIYALGQTNIAVTGEGTLDGQASRSVWPDFVARSKPDVERLIQMGNQDVPVARRIFGPGHFIRPNFIVLARCRNVLLEGVRIVDSPAWEIQPLYCTNVTVRGVRIASHGKNNDGCDPDSSREVLIENCTFDTGDDCIAIKAGRDHDGRRVNLPSEDIVIRHCLFKAGHGGVTVGSETAGGIRNVFVENCEFDSPDLDMAFRFKTDSTRGGFIRDVYIRDCLVKKARTGIHLTMNYSKNPNGRHIPIVRDIDIRDCQFEELLRQPIFIEGLSAAAPVTDVTIAHCRFPPAAGENFITNAVRIHLTGNTP